MELRAGDVAVVTGAASGIGFALADRFARAGLHVVAADVDATALDVAATALRAHGTNVFACPVDVRHEDAVNTFAARAIEHFGAVHVVCNNAGVSSRSDPWLGPIDTWKWVLDVNLWGVLHGVRAFLPHLLAGGRGHIVNTASMAGLAPGVGAPYDASKHAVVALSEDLYLDLQAQLAPVGVSVLCPGWVRTNIVDADRNWPAEHGEPPARAVTTGAIEHHFRRAIAEGLTPAEVADHVAAAVTEDRFWILPSAEWLDLAADRWDAIRAGVNPSRPDQMPGLPPTTQLYAEIIEAVLRESPE
ncbi:MAG: SDR family NAD(P)-dependent oxidoreductase [Acidimicrobiia bacterium]|jgi:NAD(P)-dependent dehydrogenase (short-subunit alcohol dehydrogenase family)